MKLSLVFVEHVILTCSVKRMTLIQVTNVIYLCWSCCIISLLCGQLPPSLSNEKGFVFGISLSNCLDFKSSQAFLRRRVPDRWVHATIVLNNGGAPPQPYWFGAIAFPFSFLALFQYDPPVHLPSETLICQSAGK